MTNGRHRFHPDNTQVTVGDLKKGLEGLDDASPICVLTEDSIVVNLIGIDNYTDGVILFGEKPRS